MTNEPDLVNLLRNVLLRNVAVREIEAALFRDGFELRRTPAPVVAFTRIRTDASQVFISITGQID
jgi:hypothetical protein